MEISIETALIIIVPVFAAVIVISMVTSQSEGATSFFDNQRTNSECDLKFQAEYRSQVYCNNGVAYVEDTDTQPEDIAEDVTEGLDCNTENWGERLCGDGGSSSGNDDDTSQVSCSRYNNNPSQCGSQSGCYYDEDTGNGVCRSEPS